MSGVRAHVILAALLAAAGCEHRAPPAPSPRSEAAQPRGRVTVREGVLQGVVEGGALAFRGVPYAAPPTGARRWKPPEPPPRWTGVRGAESYGAVCPQPRMGAPSGPVVGDEDCLFLNVWTPSHRPAGALPVMVFVHGGSNLWGGSSTDAGEDSRLDGRYLAEHGPAVVVTLNYRLGALGFLALAALSAESPDHVSGNYGLLDQIAALRWVHDNAGAFGGDPSRVMLFGESAGAIDVSALLVSPLARGLFSRALLQSGVLAGVDAEKAEASGAAFPDAIGCGAGDLACLRARPFDELVAALPKAFGASAGVTLPIVLDDHVVPRRPLEAARAGRHNHMPIVMGTNTDEYSTLIAFHAPRQRLESDDDLADELHRQFPRRHAAVHAHYPASAYPSPRAAYIAVWTDASFTCPIRRALRAFAAGQEEPVYRYVYAHVRDRGVVRLLGAGHAMEIPFVFHTFLPGGPTPIELDFSDDIVTTWTRFAATGAPGTAESPWPRFRAESDPYVRLDVVSRVERGFRSAECDFWDSVAD